MLRGIYFFFNLIIPTLNYKFCMSNKGWMNEWMNKRSIKLPVNLFKNDNDTRVKNKHYS